MPHDAITPMCRRARHHADHQVRAEREALAQLLADPGIVLLTQRMGIADLAVAASTGRIAAGPMVRLLNAAADLASQARAMARRRL